MSRKAGKLKNDRKASKHSFRPMDAFNDKLSKVTSQDVNCDSYPNSPHIRSSSERNLIGTCKKVWILNYCKKVFKKVRVRSSQMELRR